MFTRQHYVTVAEALLESRRMIDSNTGANKEKAYEQLLGVALVEAEIMAKFQWDNPRFNPTRFAKASGLHT